jgi:hypothetical protein
VAIALVGTLLLTGAFSGPDGAGATPGPDGGGSARAGAPLYPDVKEVSHRGITVNVPKDWKKSPGGNSYVDYADDTDRFVRINVEASSNSPEAFLKVAEAGLKGGNCNGPYERVGLADATMDGRKGALLEYTCGEGDRKRHGVWSAVVVDGKAYHFFLSSPESAAADSRIVHDEMMRSFDLAVS